MTLVDKVVTKTKKIQVASGCGAVVPRYSRSICIQIWAGFSEKLVLKRLLECTCIRY